MRFVLFDLGGVLFDFNHGPALAGLAPHCRVSAEELGRVIFEGGLEEAYDRGDVTTAELVAELERTVGFTGGRPVFERAWGSIFTPREDSLALVERLRSDGIQLGVVSNTNAAHFEALSKLIDFSRGFRWVFLSFRLRARKPEPMFFSRIKEYLPWPAAEGLFVDDRTENVEAARAAGFRGHVFRDASGLEELLYGGDGP